MSTLYLKGLKQGDVQMTAVGLVNAGLFFFLSLAKPLIKLAPFKPPCSVFATSVMVSVCGQFFAHFGSLFATLRLCESFLKPSGRSNNIVDGKFQPNLINSAIFLLSAAMQVNNFVINYRGPPFTQDLKENVYLWRSVLVIYVLLLVVIGGQFEPLNDFLQLAPFPSSIFQAQLLGILVLNFLVCYFAEKISLLIF